MSMCGNLVRVTGDTRLQLHNNPELISTLLQRRGQAQRSFFARLFGKRSDPAPQSIAPLQDEDCADIDKTWHAIHYLLTGTDWEGEFPMGFLVSVGQTIGDVDLGYGPARSFDVDQVSAIEDCLNGLPNDTLRARLDFGEMRRLEIYPNAWEDDSAIDEEWDYICGGLDTIRTFVRETRARSMSLIVYLN